MREGFHVDHQPALSPDSWCERKESRFVGVSMGKFFVGSYKAPGNQSRRPVLIARRMMAW
jgi:hypothetical protein